MLMRTLPKIGDRVRLVGPMLNDLDPIPVGAEGTVDWVSDGPFEQVGVKWDNGRKLLLLAEDDFEVIK